jgi:hypothetical protein
VSEIFELEQALVDAARRHHRRGPAGAARRARRRLARPLRIGLVPIALVVLVLLVIAIARTAAPPGEERPVATPTASPVPGIEDVRRTFGVFRRPRRATDALPAGVFRGRRQALTEESRLVAREGRLRLWIYPALATNGAVGLCDVVRLGKTGGGSCTALESAASESRPMSMWSPPRRGRPGYVSAIFPDGIDEVRVTMRGGTVVTRTVRSHAVLLPLTQMVTSMSWTGPTGVLHTQQYSDPDPNETPDARGCPDLEPLPVNADAQAAQAALAAVPRLYPGRTAPRVLSVAPLKPGDRGGIAYKTCGAQTASRALKVELRLRSKVRSASLSQGTLLVGRIKGRMTVWQQLH